MDTYSSVNRAQRAVKFTIIWTEHCEVATCRTTAQRYRDLRHAPLTASMQWIYQFGFRCAEVWPFGWAPWQRHVRRRGRCHGAVARPAGSRRDVTTTARWVGCGPAIRVDVSIDRSTRRANWRCSDVSGGNDCDVCWRLLSRRARVFAVQHAGDQLATWEV